MSPESDPKSAEVAFATSGHSGAPTLWLRTQDQLRAEARLLAHSVIGPVDRVVNYAPPRHLYGRLFGEELPALLGIPVRNLWDTPLVPPDLPDDERVLLVCLPSTWMLLRSLTQRLARRPGVVAVHSTGPVTDAARRLVGGLDGTAFRAVEVLGSTETGAIAHRALRAGGPGPAPWTLFDDVRLVGGPDDATERLLRVGSPRLARSPEQERPPASVLLDDLIRPVGPRRFELLGRSTRLIKINGRRVHLEQVEDALRTALPDADVVCVPHRDPLRAEHYELFYADAPGAARTSDNVHDHLARTLPGTPPPRHVHRVERIPRSATGKVRLDRLFAAVRPPRPAHPTISASSRTGPTKATDHVY